MRKTTQPLRDLRKSPGAGGQPAGFRGKGPLHVVNVALNLVGGTNLAWRERKAESFTFSPLHCGAMNLGYRPPGVPRTPKRRSATAVRVEFRSEPQSRSRCGGEPQHGVPLLGRHFFPTHAVQRPAGLVARQPGYNGQGGL
jgi:hypothetical protein